ncbi:TrkH family potassium uptake protein [Engelhardtia mirabilis]|uniref:Ktr system potassium uptake protein B n=1 Tax=Engelhardtia mirabilis TaxID=2528011 RepID=A0A518BQK6_9BACT|nr:Ktr system potassium uptake protein B [Planctomycetes bacterium Pla133]QDV03576.1 Ktr system potassium uptake protein B [Planctomycetes bacterium Pla86]
MPAVANQRRLEKLGRHGRTSGALLALSSAPFAVVSATQQDTASWSQLGALALASCLLLAALLVERRTQLGRSLATLGLLGLPCASFDLLRDAPAAALAVAVATITAIALLWGGLPALPGDARLRNRPVGAARASGAALVATAFWLLGPDIGAGPAAMGLLAYGWALCVAALAGLAWALFHDRLRSWPARGLVVVTATCGLLTLWAAPDQPWLLAPMGVNALAVLASTRLGLQSRGRSSGWDVILGHPERAFVGTFAALCLFGTLLLALPISSSNGIAIPVLDAAFTSTSAVCVTGLVVLDTPVAFSPFGQLAILALIQLGGLGVMTFYTFAIWALNRRMSLRQEAAIAGLIGPGRSGDVARAVRRVIGVAVAVEGVGFLALAVAFRQHGDSVIGSLWRGLFTSVSAFCNAGFALQSDSLVGYQDSPAVLQITALLIVLGALSPLAIIALPGLVRRGVEPVSAQVRLCLSATAVLLVGGFLFFAAFEWDNCLAGLSTADKLQNAWFQSATLRTAGFNSVGLEPLRSPTVTLMLVWMFIGGNPGSTAGGVKTTTVALLLLTVVQSIRGRSGVDVFKRRIDPRSCTKATTVVLLAASTVLVALVALQLTQRLTTQEALFEVVSALGTVGLSIGGTAKLDGIGKTIIIGCMFVGRVGGLALLMFLSSRVSSAPNRWPQEEIDVG